MSDNGAGNEVLEFKSEIERYLNEGPEVCHSVACPVHALYPPVDDLCLRRLLLVSVASTAHAVQTFVAEDTLIAISAIRHSNDIDMDLWIPLVDIPWNSYGDFAPVVTELLLFIHRTSKRIGVSYRLPTQPYTLLDANATRHGIRATSRSRATTPRRHHIGEPTSSPRRSNLDPQ